MLRASQREAFHVHYPPDGTGRDSYMKINNGGMTVTYSPKKADPVTSFRTLTSYQPPSPIIKPRAVYY